MTVAEKLPALKQKSPTRQWDSMLQGRELLSVNRLLSPESVFVTSCELEIRGMVIKKRTVIRVSSLIRQGAGLVTSHLACSASARQQEFKPFS
jgi:hypothetical protein